nr:retrovirus-related Pol polyprotein from transposon TNT 1-94 [Tanacetum cinerariifolium]
MQEEIHEFERLQVWELLSYLDKVLLIKLKWIYKVQTDELGEMQRVGLPKQLDLLGSVHMFDKKALYGLKQAPHTPVVEKSKLDEDLQGKPVDATLYRGMIGCQDTRHSTSGCAQVLGDKLVSWSSKKQKSTAISSTEAEYIALS